ncbi:MAG: pyrroloquinoline quinone biosynthesis peptide chaperone PqqD [Alphaproteobacteria bacterium]|nr:pyrroloquinoline quinone biosynthesis peptide chaperone PqqD [Rhizobiaceae bacterium]MBU3961162.1 pyrroloquinoline quinone biosynthesis peptide chaperone PqqD [Alphaproteobacteria bacterium]MBU4050948.1 pyrroloquinoline quinone biosynthesis peptide chaperone PqqD [Alphaproteobacteria bacterium]MBU4087671.1 pyrroloquinoline quinone biosynthesis peptide chaperone PqqD [Alphaproteobacteria bacterium]MBU4155669.1 pyrroloquinoline quinone biosynthesis peptide chaperone PqqD [Alphaproteobacteria b
MSGEGTAPSAGESPVETAEAGGTGVAVTGATVARLARGVRLREDPVRGQTVLLAPERALALDEIAVAIVKALDGTRDLDTIAEGFARQFEAPQDQVLADVIAFIREFSDRRLLEIVR